MPKGLPKNPTLPTDQALKILQNGEISLEGEFVWGSNYTFLVNVQFDNQVIAGVYKPSRGERPLWDFPRASLAHREVAAFLVSEALGWRFVPPTVYRQDGPAGAGSLQFFIEHNPEYHYFNFTLEDVQRLRPVVLFDYLVNNADRKGSHVLVDLENRLWLIDHGICFHVEDKLRTVIWDFAGEMIPEDQTRAINSFCEKISTDREWASTLSDHLDPREIAAIKDRASWLGSVLQFPNPPMHRRATPWPQI